MTLEWLGDALGQLNYLAVLASSIVGMVVGSVVYSPKVFGEHWRKDVGLSKKEMESNEGMGSMFFGAFVFSLFTIAVLGATLKGTGTEGFVNGAILGALFALVFTSMPSATMHLFARKPMRLTAIQGLDSVVGLALAGGILGVWG